jgi:hypothetical protein
MKKERKAILVIAVIFIAVMIATPTVPAIGKREGRGDFNGLDVKEVLG